MFYAGPKDVKDVFSALKDSAAELSESNDTLKHQACLFCCNSVQKIFLLCFLACHSNMQTDDTCISFCVCSLHLLFFFVFHPCVQITYSLLFSLIIAFLSDALSAVSDNSSILSHDASFRKEFHEIVR